MKGNRKTVLLYGIAAGADATVTYLLPARSRILGCWWSASGNITGASPTDAGISASLIVGATFSQPASGNAYDRGYLGAIDTLIQRKADAANIEGNFLNVWQPIGIILEPRTPITMVVWDSTGCQTVVHCFVSIEELQ